MPSSFVRRAFLVGALALAAAAPALRLARSGGDEGAPPQAAPFDPSAVAPFMASYADLLHAAYADCTALAERLRDEADRFVDRPSADGLDACKAAWLRARPFYVQTEIARFAEGPVESRERFMNAWPLDEAYLDGLIADPAAGLDGPALREANERGGETHVCTGWHAIEYLLWGRDVELGPGGGRRSHLEFAATPRLGQALRACAAMLVEDLAWLRDQWAPGGRNYRSWFLGTVTPANLAKILTGVGTLVFGELRGERLVVAYLLKDRENEHSCFSDTTHVDHLNDLVGVRNVWEGRYRSSDGRRDYAGPGLRDLARRVDPARADEVGRRLDAALEALADPALAPFETAILGDDSAPGRRAIQRALDGLADFNRAFCLLSARFGTPIGTTLVR
ncbi:MAG TPA: imelysin family protein [Planctomycetota bacterium]|nr:imelysin family protein [Planctomycetota bacterium]